MNDTSSGEAGSHQTLQWHQHWHGRSHKMKWRLSLHFISSGTKVHGHPQIFNAALLRGRRTEILLTLSNISEIIIANEAVFLAKSEEDDIKGMEGQWQPPFHVLASAMPELVTRSVCQPETLPRSLCYDIPSLEKKISLVKNRKTNTSL